MKLSYTDRAKDDVKIAFLWYERQEKGLGARFLDCLERAYEKIAGQPELYQVRHASFRACPIRHFPFSVIYTIEPGEIVVHAVFDNRQDPNRLP